MLVSQATPGFAESVDWETRNLGCTAACGLCSKESWHWLHGQV